jgi:hypothetical protein
MTTSIRDEHQRLSQAPSVSSSSSSVSSSSSSGRWYDHIDVLQQIVAFVGKNQYRFVAILHIFKQHIYVNFLRIILHLPMQRR